MLMADFNLMPFILTHYRADADDGYYYRHGIEIALSAQAQEIH